METDGEKLSKFYKEQAEKRREDLAKWNRENRPIFEHVEDEYVTIGLFNFDNDFYYGYKKKCGYEPETLVKLPKPLIAFLKNNYQIKELVEEINRDAWSDDTSRLRIIARTSDKVLKLLES